MQQENPWKTLSKKIVYENPWIKIHEDKVIQPQGGEGIYGYMESRDSVQIVVANENDEIYFIYTYSYPSASWNWELPGGGSDGEEAIEASKRELAEETGIIARNWTKLGCTRVCNGLMTEHQVTYLARGLNMGDRAESDDEKLVSEGRFFSWQQIQEMVAAGEINDNQTLTSLFLYDHWTKKQE